MGFENNSPEIGPSAKKAIYSHVSTPEILESDSTLRLGSIYLLQEQIKVYEEAIQRRTKQKGKEESALMNRSDSASIIALMQKIKLIRTGEDEPEPIYVEVEDPYIKDQENTENKS